MCNISKQDICVQGEEVTSVVKWKGVIWDFVYAIILPVFERCKVLIMFSGMICDGVCKMELYCERCYFLFEKRYRCRGPAQAKTLRAQSAGNNALFPVENFWEWTTGILSEIDSEKRK